MDPQDIPLTQAVNEEIDVQIDGTPNPVQSVTVTTPPDGSVATVTPIAGRPNAVKVTPAAGQAAGSSFKVSATAEFANGAPPYPFTLTITYDPRITPPPPPETSVTATVTDRRILPNL